MNLCMKIFLLCLNLKADTPLFAAIVATAAAALKLY